MHRLLLETLWQSGGRVTEVLRLRLFDPPEAEGAAARHLAHWRRLSAGVSTPEAEGGRWLTNLANGVLPEAACATSAQCWIRWPSRAETEVAWGSAPGVPR